MSKSPARVCSRAYHRLPFTHTALLGVRNLPRPKTAVVVLVPADQMLRRHRHRSDCNPIQLPSAPGNCRPYECPMGLICFRSSTFFLPSRMHLKTQVDTSDYLADSYVGHEFVGRLRRQWKGLVFSHGSRDARCNRHRHGHGCFRKSEP